MATKFRMIDLFAGTGAFSLATGDTHTCVMANDMVKPSAAIFRLNHPDTPFVLADLHSIPVGDIPAHDLLCGGFPCQPFSIAGEKKGFEDERANVFWKICDILDHHRPGQIILENVKNLTTHDGGNTFAVIQSSLEELGYHLKTQVLDTRVYTDVPQHRERIYIVGFLDPIQCDAFQFPLHR